MTLLHFTQATRAGEVDLAMEHIKHAQNDDLILFTYLLIYLFTSLLLRLINLVKININKLSIIWYLLMPLKMVWSMFSIMASQFKSLWKHCVGLRY
ncbi:hypothetical protein PN36_34825 [Candidatus Thiomargarita nelsonii]|uniref:Uncharacterized protein n=1 Tax=Candidatus Thiomargarita nelsonii TaxID=1003181 RepID=A0A4E0QQ16_9GAMM|nr:hypothetical protein PN36_34825 [Candidatus Thiomargarita nelsonii]